MKETKKKDEKAFAIHNVSNCSGVIRTERGWAGHFICANRCRFRRNTLLTYNDIMIVVPSVGLMEIDGKFDPVGAGRHFETMAFHADKNDKRYFDADVSKQVYFESDWAIAEVDADGLEEVIDQDHIQTTILVDILDVHVPREGSIGRDLTIGE